MNAELKQKWVEALRSGKYPQGINYLRTDQGYCCLGVLCDVIDGSKWQKGVGNLWTHGTKLKFLAEDEAARMQIRRYTGDLMDMNDRGQPFDKIADFIDQNIPADPTELTNCDICDVRPGHREMNASGVEGVICLECDEPREPRYSNIEPNTGLRRHGEI
jgi:hypothetical protein